MNNNETHDAMTEHQKEREQLLQDAKKALITQKNLLECVTGDNKVLRNRIADLEQEAEELRYRLGIQSEELRKHKPMTILEFKDELGKRIIEEVRLAGRSFMYITVVAMLDDTLTEIAGYEVSICTDTEGYQSDYSIELDASGRYTHQLLLDKIDELKRMIR